MREINNLTTDCQAENIDKKERCPEFPFFGAIYPDATCIDGYLWDLDSADDSNYLTAGGDVPCPFCNTEKFIEQYEDEQNTREILLSRIELFRTRYS